MRRDYDARRATTQVRYGVLHALQDSPPPDYGPTALFTMALCGRLLTFTWFHDNPEPPPALARDFCKRCLERSVEIEQ